MRKNQVSRGVEIRSEVRELPRQVPFRPFAITLKDGKELRIRQPVNIGFDPGDMPKRRGSLEFFVISSGEWHRGSFEDVSKIMLMEEAVHRSPA